MSALVSPAVGRITSPYGPRVAPRPGASTNHKGVDIADVDDAIVAAADGTVVAATSSASRGNYVTIDIGGGVKVLVQHLASRGVSVPQRVVAGQWLGKEGATGIATGVHAHVEVHVNGVNVNPSIWFAAHGVTLGSLGTGTWSPGAAPDGKPTAQVLMYQQRQNRYGAAGLVEDGIDGPYTTNWERWAVQAQTALNRWKSALARLTLDGDYGYKTHTRVREFQARNGRPVTGFLSNADCAFMRSHGTVIPNRPKTH